MAFQEKFILAIDLGTSGPKVALLTTRGALCGSEFVEVPLFLLPEGGAEQSPRDWWESIQHATRALLAQGIVPNDGIVAIALTGQWSGTVPVDEGGQPLSNALIWMDARGAPYIRQVMAGRLQIQGLSVAKLLKWLGRTGGMPATAGKDSIAHILYLKHVHPEIYRSAYKFLEPMDYIGLRLTGQMAASFDSITLHWLTDNRDIHNIRYDRELIRLAGIDPAKLPELRPSNSILGTLRPELAAEWGLRDSTPVIIGSPDIHSSAIGSGAVGDYEPHLYIGTSAWLTCHVPFKKTDLLHSLAALPSAVPGRYLLTNEQECAGMCLQYLRDNVIFPQGSLAAVEKPRNAYQLFDEIAARVPAGSRRLIFTPWLYGERAPVDDHLVRGGFFNQSLQTTREDMVRAVFEGVAYNSRWLLKYVEKFIKQRAQEIPMVGGGAKSKVWCQIHADVLNRPIRQVKEPVEVNVRGAALLASAALGYLRYDELSSCVEVEETFQPDPAHRKLYDELFESFVSIYQNNRKLYARLNRAHE